MGRRSFLVAMVMLFAVVALPGAVSASNDPVAARLQDLVAQDRIDHTLADQLLTSGQADAFVVLSQAVAPPTVARLVPCEAPKFEP